MKQRTMKISICVSAIFLLLFIHCSPKIIPLQKDGTEVGYQAKDGPFFHGIASGDPLEDRVIIWTRVTPPHHDLVHVRWEVSTNEDFSPLWQSGVIGTDSTKDYTVKIDVPNLVPGTEYFYRFFAFGESSMIGKTKTLPKQTDEITLGIVSCSNYEFGYFNAYDGLVEQDVDLVLHLGDYIYEYGPGTYGDEQFTRKHLPAKEILSLQDYRTRYAQYRLDQSLQKAHGSIPFILIWDDHEIANNAYQSGAENHQSNEGDFSQRKAIARQAYYEWQPIRESIGKEHYRSFSLGNLAEIFMLDERYEGRNEPTEDIEARGEKRTMLGAKQLKWFKKGLSNSKAQWKIIGNQVIFSPCDLNKVRPNSPFNLDAWDGYAYERDDIINHLKKNGIQNTVFVTGDTHASWAFEVPADPTNISNEKTVGIEIATPSITSSNWNESNSDAEVMFAEQMLKNSNPHLNYVNGRSHGFTILKLSPKEAKAEWHYTADIKTLRSTITKEHEVIIPANRQKFFKERSADVAITNVHVLSMTKRNDIVANQLVLIKDDKIDYIGPMVDFKTDLTIDGRGKYLMPGLTEMHAHIPVAEDGNDRDVQETLFLYLSKGVTTIRGMLGNPYHLTLKEEVANGKILGPRIYTSSPSMNGNSVPTIEEAKIKVQQYKDDGYDFLKIHPGIQLEVWNELEKTAKAINMPYAGHVPTAVGIRRALDSGYETVDHLDGFLEGLVPASLNLDPNSNGFFGYNFTEHVDMSLLPGLVQQAIDNNVAVVPTQTLFTRWFSPIEASAMMSEPEMQYMSPNVRFAWRQNKTRILNDPSYKEEQWANFIKIRNAILQELDRRGATFLLGSDAPQVMNVPGFSIHHEILDMAEVGIDPYKILYSGTAGPAQFFGANNYGILKKGNIGDMILVNGNPIENLANVSDIAAVFVKGKPLLLKEINKRLSEIALRHSAEE